MVYFYGLWFFWGLFSYVCSLLFALPLREKKLLSPVLNTLQKHFGCHKTNFATIDVVGKWYYNKDATHNKNERCILVEVKILSSTLFNLEFVQALKRNLFNLQVHFIH